MFLLVRRDYRRFLETRSMTKTQTAVTANVIVRRILKHLQTSPHVSALYAQTGGSALTFILASRH